MKLTPAGRDYLGSMVIVTALGLLAGVPLLGALGASMAFAAAGSAAMLAVTSSRRKLTASAAGARVFKGGTCSVTVNLPSRSGWWSSWTVESAKVPGGSEVKVEADPAVGFRLDFRMVLAGRVESVEVVVRFEDALGFFARPGVAIEVPASIDSLPLSLMERSRAPAVRAFDMGESPGGRPGKGQEFYAIEEYNTGTETRDIMWKRAAREPDSPLWSRVREANIPADFRVSVRSGDQEPVDRARLVDLLCEALGEAGSVLRGSGVDPVFFMGGSVRSVGSDEELAEAVMEASTCRSADAPEGDLNFVLGTTSPLPGGRVVTIGGPGGDERIDSAEEVSVAVGRALR